MATILIADDEEGLREFLVEALEGRGHALCAVADGDAAIAELSRRSFDLVLTDLKMPGLSGMEVLAHCKRSMPEVEVVVMTAHGSVDTAVEAMKRGAFDYLQKPLAGPDELRLVVDRALKQRALTNLREQASQSATIELSWGAPAMKPVVLALERLAPTSATTLLLGQSGTGKEVFARALHRKSERHDGPFVAVNCATLSGSLLESELFGHERGAFTGAAERRRGKIELASGGTFFLDEIGELKLELQAKLLRVLEERVFERVGGSQTIHADVRWVAATNRDLRTMIQQGQFREDLYHRLAVFPVSLPPLADRREDLPPLVNRLLQTIAAEQNRATPTLSENAAKKILAADWPGNVRELRNALERALILNCGDEIDSDDIWIDGTLTAAPLHQPINLADLERDAIERALKRADGNRKEAAETLGIGLRTLYSKLKSLGIG